MWMMAASLVGVVLWRTGQLREMIPLMPRLRMAKVHPRFLLLALVLVFIASKSMG